jgi:hypothetical protein
VGQVGRYGPSYGYHANPRKVCLIVKEELYDYALKVFDGTEIHVTTSGRQYLGSTIGSENLASIACSQPYSAYCALARSMKNK